jgi:uncharacterized protein YjbI with pentapeptide repeats
LQQAWLNDAKLMGTFFYDTDLSKAKLNGADLTDAKKLVVPR